MASIHARFSIVPVVVLGLACAGTVVAADCDGISAVPGESITVELIASRFSRPVDVTSPPGDFGRLFVVEQRGRILMIDLATNDTLRLPFLDISSKVVCCGESGLLGLAFHPNYSENGFFYVYYTRAKGAVCSAAPPPGCSASRDTESVIERYRVSEDPNVADRRSGVTVLSFCQPFSNHNGGQLQFGPKDNLLYIGTGDGGSGNDPCGSGQRLESLLGKILRLDVDGAAPYAIPANNPFTAVDGARPEIWALGLRNPWRFSFDRETGDLYVGDVGQGAWEEIDYVAATNEHYDAGLNFEWKAREGNHNFRNIPLSAGERIGAIFDYGHSSGEIRGLSVTGGVVYRGCRMPDLRGRYFFADYQSRWVRSFRVEDGALVGMRNDTRDLREGIPPQAPARFKSLDVSAFGLDGRGEIYICELDGAIFRIVPAARRFNRGDANADGRYDISDPVMTLLALFVGTVSPPCMDALDVDDDGKLQLNDAVFTLEFLFRDGLPIPEPSSCGVDESEDNIECEEFPACE